MENTCTDLGGCGISGVIILGVGDIAIFVFVLVVGTINKFLATFLFTCNPTLLLKYTVNSESMNWNRHPAAHNFQMEMSK